MKMAMCKDHWNSLRKSLEAAGLGEFIVSDVQELADRLKHTTKPDPLFSANSNILHNALRANGGPFDGCPLCKCDEGGGDSAGWIAQAVKDEVESRDWIGRPEEN